MALLSSEAEESFSEGFQSDEADERGEESADLWQQLCALQHGLSEVERKISKHSSLQEARQQRCTRNRHRWVLQQQLQVSARFKTLLPPGVSLASPKPESVSFQVPETPARGPRLVRPVRRKKRPSRVRPPRTPTVELETFCLDHQVSKEEMRPLAARVRRSPPPTVPEQPERGSVVKEEDMIMELQALANSFVPPSTSSSSGTSNGEEDETKPPIHHSGGVEDEAGEVEAGKSAVVPPSGTPPAGADEQAEEQSEGQESGAAEEDVEATHVPSHSTEEAKPGGSEHVPAARMAVVQDPAAFGGQSARSTQRPVQQVASVQSDSSVASKLQTSQDVQRHSTARESQSEELPAEHPIPASRHAVFGAPTSLISAREDDDDINDVLKQLHGDGDSGESSDEDSEEEEEEEEESGEEDEHLDHLNV